MYVYVDLRPILSLLICFISSSVILGLERCVGDLPTSGRWVVSTNLIGLGLYGICLLCNVSGFPPGRAHGYVTRLGEVSDLPAQLCDILVAKDPMFAAS